MESKWKTVSLVEMCSKIGSGSTPKGGNSVYIDDGELALIRSQNIYNNNFRYSGLAFINSENAQKLANVEVLENDILLNITGDSVARCCQVDPSILPARVNQHVAIIRPIPEILHAQYLQYYLVSPSMQAEMLSLAGVGATRNALTKGMIEQFEIPLPPLAEQKRIAHILSTLDDKIELNRKMNATLEAMAQALFKSWFVDFDPVIDNALLAGNPIPEPLQPRAETRRKALGTRSSSSVNTSKEAPSELPPNKDEAVASSLPEYNHLFPNSFTESEELGWIPEGWETSTLGNYLEIKRGGSPRPIKDYIQPTGLPWVKIADATASPSRFLSKTKECIKPEGLKKTVLLKKGSLILSNSATPGLPMFLELDACIHDGWLHFPRKEYFGDQYLYQLFLVIREELVNKGNGSVFTNLKTDILRVQNIVVPSPETLSVFEEWTQFNASKVKLVNLENQTLTKIRDSVLPRLISEDFKSKKD